MNGKIIGIIIAIVVIAGGAYLFTQKDKTSEVASNTDTTQQAETTGAETASIKSLIDSGKTKQCTFTTVAEGSESKGTIYVADGKMRGDFNVVTKDVAVMSHTIFDGTTSFIWTDNAGDGIKMKVDPSEIGNSQNQSVDVNKDFEFDCDSWNADSGKFVPPANVKFNEMPTVPASATTPNSADTKAMQQAICNNLPEPSKSQCLAGIK